VALTGIALALPGSAGAAAQRLAHCECGTSLPDPVARQKNGSHNQPAGPKLEPSHIYHFKGKVAPPARSPHGTDNQGNRIAFARPLPITALCRANMGGEGSAIRSFTHI